MENLAGKKVEVICADSAGELMRRVNEFLATHDPVYDIQYQAIPRSCYPDHAALIIYG